MAKKLRLSGDVTLRLVVEADGSTSRIGRRLGRKTGFGEAAVRSGPENGSTALRAHRRPRRCRLKIVRIRFSMEPEREAAERLK